MFGLKLLFCGTLVYTKAVIRLAYGSPIGKGAEKLLSCKNLAVQKSKSPHCPNLGL